MAHVVYFVKDLMFSSKIRAAASELGLEARSVREPDGIAAAARGASLVILDLRLPEVMRAADLMAADPEVAGVRSVGFVDHEKVEIMEEAERHGIQQVLTKGRFSADLPMMLASLQT